MKTFLVFTLATVLAISCRKDINSGAEYPIFLAKIQSSLADSLSKADYENLDFRKVLITNRDSSTKYLRIPFKGIKISEQFVLLKTNVAGKILNGFIINLKKDDSEKDKQYSYNGDIKISSLNRSQRLESRIINGYISAFHPDGTQLRSMVVPHESNVLPEVVVTCYIRQEGGGISYGDWMNLLSFFGGGNSGVYSSMDGGGGGGGGGGSEGYVNGEAGPLPDRNNPEEMMTDEQISIDFEPVEDLAPIDINKYLKCFSNIPDNGSTCSITIFADIPVDDHPDKFFDWSTGSPGHTFLQINKTNGNESVVQYIGFYPVQGWKSLTSAPVTGKFVDNSQHEFNASLKMNITADQLKNTLAYVTKLSTYVKYDIDEYNCTDFALDVFNYSRASNPVEIPKVQLPYGSAPSGTRTPQELYKTLDKMQRANVERPNINFPGIKAWADYSKGPCN